MAKVVFSKVDYPLNKLIEDVDFGDIGLPEIQRPFVWNDAKVRDLLDSMYKGFPIGYLLFWSNNQSNVVKQIGTGEKQRKIPRLLIVDGQQRLTSLYAVFKGKKVLDNDYKERKINIAFAPLNEEFKVTDAAVRRDPTFIPDISEMWTGGKSSFSVVTGYMKALKKSHEINQEEEGIISKAIERLFGLHEYPLTALEVSSAVDEENVANIFVRINSKGTNLNQADFILTLLSVFWDEGRKDLESFSYQSRKTPESGVPSPYNHFIEPDPDQLLRVAIAVGFKRGRLQHVYSILRGKNLETGQFSEMKREQQFEVLKKAQEITLNLTNWHEFLKVLVSAGYRSKYMISSQITLLYAYALYLIGMGEFHVEPFRLRKLIAKWFMMSALTGRYTTSPETVLDGDLNRIKSVDEPEEFVNSLEKIIRDSLTSDFWNITLPNNLETSSARSPALFAFYASLNLLSAKVLLSNTRVSELLDPNIHAPRSPLERHHLFPKGYLVSCQLNL